MFVSRRLTALAGSVLMAATAVTPVATAAAVAPAVAPLLWHSTSFMKAAPTTAQCERFFGLACYSPNQYQAAYDMQPLYDRGLDGKGKTIVLVDAFGSPTIAADLKKFDRDFGLPDPPSLKVLQPVGPVPPFDPNDGVMANWALESTLDVEYAHAMAPGANIVLVEPPVAETQGIEGIPEIVAAENYVVDHGLGDVISQSFGATEQTFASQAQLRSQRSAFVNASKHNVTVLAASGDQGATAQSNRTGTRYYTHRVVIWPSSDPLVTSVGGTQLHLGADGSRLQADNVWNDINELGSLAAAGGGRSSVFARPGYQASVAGIVGPHRAVPDVSMSAAVDGGGLVYLSFLPGQAGYYLVGGTSEATPLFAGVVAVAAQAAHRDLGLLNPALYALGAGSSGLPDVTTGNNTASFVQDGRDVTVPGFSARAGYDLSSGLGTVDGKRLVAALAAS